MDESPIGFVLPDGRSSTRDFRHRQRTPVHVGTVGILLSPLTLAFLAGLGVARLGVPAPLSQRVVNRFAGLLLAMIGFQGGRGLATADGAQLGAGVVVTLTLIVAVPVVSLQVARRIPRLTGADAAALATLYGSVSSAVFIAAYSRAADSGMPADGFVPALVGLMELGLLVAVFAGRRGCSRSGESGSTIRSIAILGTSGALLFASLVAGFLLGDRELGRMEEWFDRLMFAAVLLFMLDMGMTAAGELGRLREAGAGVLLYAIGMPAVNGTLAVLAARWAGLSPGSVIVLAAVAASASFINGPAVVRSVFPHALPGVYLTSALGITFPLLIVVGLPVLQWIVGR